MEIPPVYITEIAIRIVNVTCGTDVTAVYIGVPINEIAVYTHLSS